MPKANIKVPAIRLMVRKMFKEIYVRAIVKLPLKIIHHKVDPKKTLVNKTVA